jgi:probable rRNA maturation factor
VKLQLDIQCECAEPVPDEDDIRQWIEAALDGRRDTDTEISLRLVGVPEMTRLNQTWRGKSGPTNVLSFPSDLPQELNLPLLGDIVVCVPVVEREAREQGKALDAHWAHMTVHGILHLLGYDHIEEHDAVAMEALETDILARLNYPCPYQGEHSEEPAQA